MQSKKFKRAMDPRKFLEKGTHHTTLTPQQALKMLRQLESRAVKVDARTLSKNESLPAVPLTAMEMRALNDAIRLALVRVGMLKVKNKGHVA